MTAGVRFAIPEVVNIMVSLYVGSKNETIKISSAVTMCHLGRLNPELL